MKERTSIRRKQERKDQLQRGTDDLHEQTENGLQIGIMGTLESRSDPLAAAELDLEPQRLGTWPSERAVPASQASRFVTRSDPYEEEADRIADQVAQSKQPNRNRGEKLFQLAPKTQDDVSQSQNVMSIAVEGVQSSGQPLDSACRGFMEPRFGHDFSQVRIHTDQRAVESAKAVNAEAYTRGRDIVFASGQYMPTTSRGRRLLAHELAHVVQQDSIRTIQRQAAPAVTPQREAPSPVAGSIDQEILDMWEAIGGPDLISTIKADLSEWEVYRTKPTTHASMPGKGSARKISDAASKLWSMGYRMHPKYFVLKNYATSLIVDGAHYFQELASFNSIANVDDIFAGISSKSPGHKYTLQVVEQLDLVGEAVKPADEISEELLKKLPDGPVKDALEKKKKEELGKIKGRAGRLNWVKATEVVVSYTSSAFPNVIWHKPLTVVGLSWSVSAKGSEGGPVTINIDAIADADPAPVGFWGMDDIAGVVTIASAAGEASVAGESALVDASVVRFAGSGPGSALQFGQFKGTVKTSGIGKLKEASFSLGAGLGWAFGGEGESHTQGYEPKAIESEEVLARTSISMFETGKADVPPEGLDKVVRTLNLRINAKRDEVLAFKDDLKKLGIEQEFKLTFFLEGWASRIWKVAPGEATRLEQNEKLSLLRAQQVATELEKTLPERHDFIVTGSGAGVLGAKGEEERPRAIPDVDADELLAKERERYKKEHPAATPEDIEEDLQRKFGRESNDPMIRGVNITVVWKGWKLVYEPIMESREAPRGEPSPGPSGGGGTEGAAPWPWPGAEGSKPQP